MRIVFGKKAFYLTVCLAVSVATNASFAATTGKMRCLGVQGMQGATTTGMVIQVHNPNPSTLRNVLRVTRVRQYARNGVLTDSGAITETVGPDNTLEYEIPESYGPLGSNAIEISWSLTNDLAKRPIIQAWVYAETQSSGVSFSTARCQ